MHDCLKSIVGVFIMLYQIILGTILMILYRVCDLYTDMRMEILVVLFVLLVAVLGNLQPTEKRQKQSQQTSIGY